MRSYFTKAIKRQTQQRQRTARRKANIVRVPKADRPPRSTMPSACAICEQPTTDLCADHCHTSGKSRDWLCRTCNAGLGMFKDSPELLERAAAYLHKHASTGDQTAAMFAAYRAHHPRANATIANNG